LFDYVGVVEHCISVKKLMERGIARLEKGKKERDTRNTNKPALREYLGFELFLFPHLFKANT
jgi:hypothetical protein